MATVRASFEPAHLDDGAMVRRDGGGEVRAAGRRARARPVRARGVDANRLSTPARPLVRPARARVATTATRATAVDDAVAAVSQAKEAALSVLGTLPDADAVASALEEARAKVDLGDVDVDAALASLRATLDALSIDALSIDALSIDAAAAQALDIDPMAAWRMESAVAAAAGDEPALAGAVAAAVVAGASLAIARVAGVSGDDASTKSTHYDGETYDGLPTVYDIPAIREYWSERPLAAGKRAGGLVAKLSTWALSVLSDVATGNVETNSRKRAAAMRDLISEQGPAFVKVGQAIAIRPDLLPQAYLDELQKLLDQVAPFGSDEARATIEASLGDGVTLDDVFEDAATAFAQPVAAASIGQVYKATLRLDAPGVDQSESGRLGPRRRRQGAATGYPLRRHPGPARHPVPPRGRRANPHR